MPEIILPSTLVGLLAAFEPCFHAPSYRASVAAWPGGSTAWVDGRSRRWRWHRAGWAGATSRCSIGSSARATWSLDAVGQVVFRLALAWIPADQPLFVLIDDTLARKTGKGIALATMHHDPLLSSARKPFCSFGPGTTSSDCR